MRRRLDLAMTLVGSPRVIFLDEPTTGLDPRAAARCRVNIRDLVASGVTILITTQYLDEADDSPMHRGSRARPRRRRRYVATSSNDASRAATPLQAGHPSALRAAADLLDDVACDDEEFLNVPTDGAVASLRHMLERLDDAQIEVEHLSLHSPNLDDVFFAVTGRPPRMAPPAMTAGPTPSATRPR